MDRRNFIVGVSTVALATQIPSVAEAVVNTSVTKPIIPLEESLLFHKNIGTKGHLMRVLNLNPEDSLFFEANTGVMSPSAQAKFAAQKAKRDIEAPKEMGYRVVAVTSDTTVKFTDADDLDQYYFNKCAVREIDDVLSKKNFKRNWFEVERASNQIAKDTRLGKANNVILNEKNLDVFEKLIMDEKIVGRYKVHTRSWVKENEILVFYRSESLNGAPRWDIPGLVFDDGGIALNKDFEFAQKIVFKS